LLLKNVRHGWREMDSVADAELRHRGDRFVTSSSSIDARRGDIFRGQGNQVHRAFQGAPASHAAQMPIYKGLDFVVRRKERWCAGA
jgi:hypothetical protein